jgi:hypothetical protein
MPSANGAPTREAQRLASKDFSAQVASLDEQRMISRSFLRQAVGDFDPEWINLPRLYQMRKDPMIQMGLHFCKFPLIRAKWHIDCEDPRIAAGVTEIIRKVYGPYTRVFLNMLDFGYQGGIKQFALGQIDGTFEDERGNQVKIWDDEMVRPLVLKPPLPLPPDYCTPKIEKGHFAGINSALGIAADAEQRTDEDRFIPAEWAIWTVNEFEEHFRNYFGYPRTGYAYRYWWSYWFRFHMEDRHFEMDADPALTISYPPGDSLGTNGQMTSNKQLALEIGNDLRGGATIAWPSDVHVDEQGRKTTAPLWHAEFLQGGENLEAFRNSAEYLDILKLRSVLVPEQALVEGKGGTSSRNVAATYGDIFRESLGQMGDDLDDYWNTYLIPQIVSANWGADAPACTKKTTGFEDEDLTLAGELVKLAFNADPNALPLDFRQILEIVHLPVMSVKEQKEREQQMQEQQMEEQKIAMEQAQAIAAEQPPPGQEQPPAQGLSIGGFRLPEATDPVIFLHQGEAKIQSTAPEWARIEADRRERNIDALTTRLQRELEVRYTAVIEMVASYIKDLGKSESSKLSLAFRRRSRVKKFLEVYNSTKDFVLNTVSPLDERVKSEVANMYHASGASQLIKLGQKLDNWDVTRDDIQQWAEDVVDLVLSDSDASLLEIHIRPWLEEQFEGGSYEFDPEPALKLSQKLRVKFLGYPRWMALRTARTEARRAYNNASLDVWELSGISRVRAYDGLGGVTGRTDETCLSRNGKIYSIEQARKEDASEHPNGTLGFVPIIDETVALIELSQTPTQPNAPHSDTVYVIDDDGNILSEQQIGRLLTEPANAGH